MFGDALLAFFIIAPAAISAITAGQHPHRAARAIALWAGTLWALLTALALLPSLLCDGGLYAEFADCTGGAGVTSAVQTAAPLIRLTLLTYVLTAPLFALLVALLNRAALRTARPLSNPSSV